MKLSLRNSEPDSEEWYSDGQRTGQVVFDAQQRQDFSLLHSIQTSSGAHLALYPMGTGGDFRWGKADGA
jgi:hypothetical protein